MNSQVIHHHCNFVPHNTIQNWITVLQRSLPTPPIMPEIDM
jgi:hypothetical protein